ncbi:hypothetical protein ES703_67369 [subsurface metagenome]
MLKIMVTVTPITLTLVRMSYRLSHGEWIKMPQAAKKMAPRGKMHFDIYRTLWKQPRNTAERYGWPKVFTTLTGIKTIQMEPVTVKAVSS